MTAPGEPRAVALVAAALEIEPEHLDAATRMEDVLEWDSLGHLKVLAALEEALGRELDADELLAVESVADVSAALNDRRQG